MNGHNLLATAVHQAAFGSQPGRLQWEIVPRDGSQAADLTPDEAAWLLALNQAQADLDAAQASLDAHRWARNPARRRSCRDRSDRRPAPCILSYQFATAPSPLQVSGEAQPSPGMVNVWISAPPGQTIYCREIDIAVPVGTGPGQFSTVAPTLTPNTTWWASSGAIMSDGEELGPPPGLTWAIFKVRATSPDYWNINYQLVFSVVTTSVNPVPDTFPFVANEYAAPDSPDNMIQRRTTFTLEKAPVRLYLDNFVSVSASQSETTVPKTEFTSGEAIRLLWESNGTTFSLYAADATSPLWTGPDTSYTLNGGVTTATTFTLLAAMDQDRVASAVAITITNPAATPRSEEASSLTVALTSSLTGDSRVGPATVGGLTASGLARLAGVTAPSATVTGQSALASATLAGTTISGAIGGSGSVALGSATAPAVTVTSGMTALAPRTVQAGVNYSATSDGILTGTVWFPSNAGTECAARISGTASSVGTVYATGGNASPWINSKEAAMWSNANSFALPVPQGSTFSVGVTQRFGTGAPTAFAWFPLARNATLHEVDLEPAVLPLPPGPDPVVWRRPNLRRQIERVADAVGACVGDRLTPRLRHQLITALEALVRQPHPASHHPASHGGQS